MQDLLNVEKYEDYFYRDKEKRSAPGAGCGLGRGAEGRFSGALAGCLALRRWRRFADEANIVETAGKSQLMSTELYSNTVSLEAAVTNTCATCTLGPTSRDVGLQAGRGGPCLLRLLGKGQQRRMPT